MALRQISWDLSKFTVPLGGRILFIKVVAEVLTKVIEKFAIFMQSIGFEPLRRQTL